MFSIAVEIDPDAPEVRPFSLMRGSVLAALEGRRGELLSMYSPVMGRPETDPVLLMAVTVLQMMQRLPDRACVAACRFDARWRHAFGGAAPDFHPTTLTNFRARLARNGKARLALDSCLQAMREAGFLRRCRAARVDSTHLLADIGRLSRLECVRETLRAALAFLAEFGGAEAWEPWHSRYADPNPEELRDASKERLRATMDQAGADARDILAKTDALGAAVAAAGPVALLRRVLEEQFETRGGDGAAASAPLQRDAAPPGAVVSPRDPEAQWSTKKTLGAAGWQGYKAQVCETVHGEKRAKGEPTLSVVTAIRVQPATASDHGSLAETLAQHTASADPGHAAADLPSPGEVHADAGYISAPALVKAAEDGYELTGPMPAPPHGGKRFGSDAFDIDIPNRAATCPAGHPASECSRIDDARAGVRYYFAWSAACCAACPLRAKCLSENAAQSKRPRRALEVGEHHMMVQQRRRLCKTDAYKQRLKCRAAIEGTHSELARAYGFRRCRYLGLAKTQLQAHFTAAACDLRRWAARLCWEGRHCATQRFPTP